LGKYTKAIESYNKSIEFISKVGEFGIIGEAPNALDRLTEVEAAFTKAKKLGHIKI
jgi:hypothetical protein